MLLYWGQSIVVGVFATVRVLALATFTTEHEQLKGRRIRPTPGFKRGMAAFFVLWFGLRHAIILFGLFLWSPGEPLLTRWFWISTVGFAAHHLFTCVGDIRRDRRDVPNIYRLTTIPYMRTLPPLLTVTLVGPLVSGALGFVVLGVMRTVVDVWMHLEDQVRSTQSEIGE